VTWDRWRNIIEGVALASSSRSASTTSPLISNHNARAILVFLDITAVSGTGGLVLKINGRDPATGKMFKLNVDTTLITAIGNYLYAVGLGVTKDSASQGGTQSLKQATAAPLPRQLEIFIYNQDSTTYTYSVGYALSV